MTVVAVELEDRVYQDLEQASCAENLPSDQLISRIVANYLHVEKVNKIRRELKGTAEAVGYLSEEAIYRDIS